MGTVDHLGFGEQGLELTVEAHGFGKVVMHMPVTNVHNGLDVIPYDCALRGRVVRVDTVTVYGAERPTVERLLVSTGPLSGTVYSFDKVEK